MHRVGVAGLIVVALLGMGAECAPSQTTNPGGKKTVTVRISSGTTLGKNNYGLWKAKDAEPNCRWTLNKNGKRIGSGGPNDSVISSTSSKGAVLSAKHCGYFYK